MLISDVMPTYLTSLLIEKRASKATIKKYRSGVQQFLAWKDSVQTTEELTPIIIRRYLFYVSSQKLRPRTVKGKIDPLRSFCRWCVEEGILTTNPCTTIKAPKLDAAVRLLVNDEQVIELLKACDRFSTQRKCCLLRALLGCMIYGGMRHMEICNLQVTDINIAGGWINIKNAKGGKTRRIYPYTDLIHSLRDWLAIRGDCEPGNDKLFAYRKDCGVSETGLSLRLEQVKAIAGYKENEAIKPHSLRHWCATNLIRNGMSIEHLRVYLGHSHVTTTAIYVHSKEEDLRSISNLGQIHSLRVQPTKPEPIHTPEPRRVSKPAVNQPARRRIALR